MTFVGFVYVVRNGRNVRMTALYDTLSLRSKKALLTLISITTGLLLLYLAYKSVFYVLEIKAVNRLSTALQFPVYIIYSVIRVSLALASLQYAPRRARRTFDIHIDGNPMMEKGD